MLASSSNLRQHFLPNGIQSSMVISTTKSRGNISWKHQQQQRRRQQSKRTIKLNQNTHTERLTRNTFKFTAQNNAKRKDIYINMYVNINTCLIAFCCAQNCVLWIRATCIQPPGYFATRWEKANAKKKLTNENNTLMNWSPVYYTHTHTLYTNERQFSNGKLWFCCYPLITIGVRPKRKNVSAFCFSCIFISIFNDSQWYAPLSIL